MLETLAYLKRSCALLGLRQIQCVRLLPSCGNWETEESHSVKHSHILPETRARPEIRNPKMKRDDMILWFRNLVAKNITECQELTQIWISNVQGPIYSELGSFLFWALFFNFLPLLTRSSIKENSPEKGKKLKQILFLLDFTWCLFCSRWLSSTRVVTKGEFEVWADDGWSTRLAQRGRVEIAKQHSNLYSNNFHSSKGDKCNCCSFYPLCVLCWSWTSNGRKEWRI